MRRTTYHLVRFCLYVKCLVFVVVLGTVPMQAAQTLQQIKTVFVIAMENHNFTQPNPTSNPQQIFGNTAAPYLNSLVTPGSSNAAQVSFATRYYNVGIGVHPSEPNYIWAEAGTDFGIHTDDVPNKGDGNIFDAPASYASIERCGHFLEKL